tara:strand:+ start:207 stop:851 length:645 start_codon:yes stop_codon:yes gene_type:complete
MNKIVILGRGESLKRLPELKEYIDTVILVNAFWDTPQVEVAYYKDPLIHNFIKDKKIILLMTHCVDARNIGVFLSKYNVIDMYTTSFSTPLMYNNKVRRKCFSVSGMPNIKPLPDELRPYYIENVEKFHKVGSTSLAFTYAKIILKCTDIYIFGVDFYERDYYLKNKHDYSKETINSTLIKQDWLNFFNRHSDINLHLYTLADFELNIHLLTNK